MTTEHKPHISPGYSEVQRQADGIRQLVGYIVDETPQNDDVDEYERKIDKWLSVWVETHERLEEQLEAAKTTLQLIDAACVHSLDAGHAALLAADIRAHIRAFQNVSNPASRFNTESVTPGAPGDSP